MAQRREWPVGNSLYLAVWKFTTNYAGEDRGHHVCVAGRALAELISVRPARSGTIHRVKTRGPRGSEVPVETKRPGCRREQVLAPRLGRNEGRSQVSQPSIRLPVPGFPTEAPNFIGLHPTCGICGGRKCADQAMRHQRR